MRPRTRWQNAPMRRLAPLVALVVLAGCGGGGDGGTQPPARVTTPVETPRVQPVPTGEPKFSVTLTAESTTPAAGRPWRYTVTAVADGGGAAGGTAKMRVFVEGQLTDTLGHFAFEGRLTRTYVWPSVHRGSDEVVLQAEVEGEGGSVRVNLPVTVR